MKSPVPVAILGAGPAGCALAAFFAQRGVPSVLFSDDKRPDLLVGESLIPAVVPILRRLGIEERVAEFSMRKPGATFLHEKAKPVEFSFTSVAHLLPPYSYNVPRPRFDNLLTARAAELGVPTVHCRGVAERAPEGSGRELQLTAETLAAADEYFRGRQPDLIVDATGRARHTAKVLGLEADLGTRTDVAHFAHFEGFRMPEPEGTAVLTLLSRGWNWRIPLRDGRLSVGIVVNKELAKHWGSSPAEVLENAIRNEPLLARDAGQARRVTDVQSYANYQLVSKRASGPGWVAVGDAFGFVDPMLSSGLFLALEAARVLDEALFGAPEAPCDAAQLQRTDQVAAACRRAEETMRDWLRSWMETIRFFYEGQIFCMSEAGKTHMGSGRNPVANFVEHHSRRAVAGLASGATTRSRWSRGLVRFVADRLIWGVPPPSVFTIR